VNDIEPDNIAQLVDELRVVGELGLLDPVRLKTMCAPYALDGTCTDADCFRHHNQVTGKKTRRTMTDCQRWNF
jgi:hypothetical protein